MARQPQRKGPGDNETFVRFVQSIRSDPEFGMLLRKAGSLPKPIRVILFDQMAAKMADSGEPVELIEVVRWLQEEAVLKKVLKMLDEEPD